MQMKLIELLNMRQICHPTKILSTEFHDGSGVISLGGFPWWLENPKKNSAAKISFQFSGIEESWMSESWFMGDTLCEDLEDFSIEQMNEQLWTANESLTIYCSAPLVDKFSLLGVVDQFLGKANCPYEIGDYLNMPTIKDFGEISSTSSYQICSGPRPICEQIVAELEQQGVPHSKVEHATKEDDRLIVRMHNGYMICRSADAIF